MVHQPSSEEILMTGKSAKVAEVKKSMQKDFEEVYELCHFVLESYNKNSSEVKFSLVQACLKTLQAFLSWIPSEKIFFSDLIDFILALSEIISSKMPERDHCIISG